MNTNTSLNQVLANALARVMVSAKIMPFVYYEPTMYVLKTVTCEAAKVHCK